MHPSNSVLRSYYFPRSALNLLRIAAVGVACMAFLTAAAVGENFIPTTGNVTWNSTANWVGATIPNGVGATANFPNVTGTRNVSLDANITVGNITINNNTSSTTDIVQGTSVNGLKFSNGGTSTITVTGAGTSQNRIDTDMVIQDQLTIDVQNTTFTNIGAFSLLGRVSGPGGVTKSGDGGLTWAFTVGTTDRYKTFTGPTILNGGRTRMSIGAEPTATSSFTINAGGQLNPISNGTYDFGAPGTVLSLNGLGPASGPYAPFPGAIRPDTNLNVAFSNPITLAGDALVHSNGTSGVITLSNVISGPGKLILTQAVGDGNNGRYFLTNTGNTYAGGTAINGGTLDVTTGNLGATTGPLTVNVQAFTGASTIVYLNTSTPTTVGSLSGTKNGTSGNSLEIDNGGLLLTVNQTTSGTYEGTITNAGGFTLGALSTSTLALVGSNAYVGGTTISGGALQANHGVGLPTNSFLSLDGGVLQGNGAVTFSRALGTSGSKVQWTANGGGFSANGGQMTVNIGGSGAEVVWGTNVGSQIAGPLRFGSTTANAKTLFVNGIDLNNTATTGVSRTIDVTAGTGGDSAEISGVIRNTGAATNLTKTGNGVLIVSGSNTYSGGTSINGGTLKANNSGGSATGSGAVAVNSSGTLAGSGTVTGAVTVNNGGTLAPGNSVGALKTGTLTFNASSTYAYEINSGVSLSAAADLVNANGNLTINSAASLSVSDLGNTLLPFGTKFTLISYAGSWNSVGFNGQPDGSELVAGLNRYKINYNDASGGSNFDGGAYGHFVTLTAVVPEASSFLLVGLCGLVASMMMSSRGGRNGEQCDV